MAVRLSSLSGNEVSDLCLGKPALRSLCVTDTVADALSALKRTGDTYLSIWNCHHSLTRGGDTNTDHNNKKKREIEREKGDSIDCKCIGRVCMVDIICFLCKPENLSSPATALRSSVSLLLPDLDPNSPLVQHLQPNASLLEAIEAMYDGVQNLVIPIRDENENNKRLRKRDNTIEALDTGNTHNYCWLTQEDVIRYLLNSIGAFSPTPASPINTLGVIDTLNLFALYYDDPASSALDLLAASLVHQSSVAVVDAQGKLLGEISPFMLNSCDEAVAPAMATLSAGDLLTYIDSGGPPEDLVQLVKERLQEQSLGAAMELLGEESSIVLPSWPSFSSTSSSDEDFCSSSSSGKNWY